MSSPISSNSTPLESPVTAKSKRLVKLLIAVSFVVVLLAVIAIAFSFGDSRRFSRIDHGADSLTTTNAGSDGARSESSETAQPAAMTTYKNAKSEVSLVLPGVWKDVDASSMKDPDLAHRFCVIRSQDHVFAAFWPLFPDTTLSLDADVNAMKARYVGGGYTVVNQKSLFVRGRNAILVRFKTPSGNIDQDLLAIRKGAVLVLFEITGSASSDVSWSQVENSLPESIEIR